MMMSDDVDDDDGDDDDDVDKEDWIYAPAPDLAVPGGPLGLQRLEHVRKPAVNVRTSPSSILQGPGQHLNGRSRK